MSEEELLKVAATVEGVSEHPLAKAVIEKAMEYGESACNIGDKVKACGLTKFGYNVVDFSNYSGMGVVAKIEKIGENGSVEDELTSSDFAIKEVSVGNRKLLNTLSIRVMDTFDDNARLCEEKGQTPLFVAIDGKLEGIICVADTIKETSREAVAMMKKAGLHVVMLTGDNKGAANAIGKEAGCDEIIAEVLPEDKAGVVSKLQEEGRKVMMVGDGINDAPALTQADVGCAIGNGSDIAIEAGDIVLMKSDLLDVPAAIRLSRLTITNIKENLFWAFLYNSIGLPVAAGVLYSVNGLLLNPMLGGLSMSLSSVCVVTNALRLKTKRIRKK
ncbi:MAG: HAD-IC family P-type ATPase, partial [Lachnospiraceae bacterium]|nr:HAD-IC family P-type ATPase [Lachnospiraceae bacterium]